MTAPRRRTAAATLGLILAALAGGCGSHQARSGSAHAAMPRTTAAKRAVKVGSAARAPRIPGGDWTQFDYDASRDGVGPAQTGITAGDLHRLQRRTVQLDGTVDSAPVELHAVKVRGRVRDVVIVTTSYGRTIALDPGTGRKLWEFAPGDTSSLEGSSQVTTMTPIVDPSRRYVYSASPNGYIHKLTVAGGHPVWSTRITFDPTREKLEGALNISRRSVIAAVGGYYGDQPSYQGHLVLIDRASGRISRVWNALCSNRRGLIDPPSSCPASDAAIWGRAGSVVVPGSGRILVATGNAPFNGSTDWGDSVLELSPALGLLHNWTPTDQASLNSSDADLGSTEPALLPGTTLAVQGGKDGILRLLDLNRLNGTNAGAGARTGGELQQIRAPGPTDVDTAPAVWRHRGHIYVIVADNAGTESYVLGGNRRLSVHWQDGTPGTSPVLAGGLLYVYDASDGTLVIRDPLSGRALDTLPAASGHWNSPIVVGGRIILPEGNYQAHQTSGTLDIYHLPGR